MEAAYVALMRAALDAHWAAQAPGRRPPLPNDVLALNMSLSLLYTCCTRVGGRLVLLHAYSRAGRLCPLNRLIVMACMALRAAPLLTERDVQLADVGEPPS